jgi:pimeloyl-ACP methyl ester carboxylesterase
LLLLAAALVATSACGDDDGTGMTEEPTTPGDGSDRADGATPDDDDDDDDAPNDLDAARPDGSVSSRMDGGRDAGRDASGARNDGGELIDAAVGSSDASSPESVDASTIDSGLAADGGVVVTMDAAVGPEDYDQPGPHKVIQENNVGMGFSNNAPDDQALCRGLVPLLDPSATPAEVDSFANFPPGMNMDLYTVFRPELLEEGKKYPVITWGNGTCATPVGYDELLKHLASYGYIVIGPNTRQVGNGQAMRRALDWLTAENGRSGSPYFGKVDLMRIGASGHSQGGASAITVTAADGRIIAAVPIEPGAGSGMLNKPTFFLAGENDTVVSPASVQRLYAAARGPSLYGVADRATHTTPIREPQLIWGPIVAWFKAHLERDATARTWFYGTCNFCGNTNWTVQRKNLN